MRIRFLFLLCVLLGACSTKGKNEFTPSRIKKEPLELVRIKTIHLKTHTTRLVVGALLSAFEISTDGSQMAFYDYIHQYVLVTDSLGNLLHIIGEKGKGPKEFVQIQSWCLDEDGNLIVYDDRQKMMKIFSSEGKLKQSFRLGSKGTFFPKGRGLAANDGLIYVPVIQPGYQQNRSKIYRSNLFAIMDYKGHLKRMAGHYDPYSSVSPDYEIAPEFAFKFKQNEIFSTHTNSYRIQVWDLPSFTRSAYFGYRAPDYKEAGKEIPIMAPKKEIAEMGTKQNYTELLFASPKYIAQIFDSYTKEYIEDINIKYVHAFISVYDRATYNFLGEIPLPQKYIGAAHNGKLYLIDNDNPDDYTIGVYKIQ